MGKFKNIFLSFAFLPQFFLLGTNQEFAENPVFITSKQPVIQRFTAEKNNLYEIDLFTNKRNLNFLSPMTFTLRDDRGDVISKIDFDAKNIGANYWLRLTFNPINNSKGKTYTAQVIAPLLETNEVEIGYTQVNRVKNIESFLGDKKLDGNYAFKLLYRTDIRGVLESIKDKALERFSKDKSFFIFYIGSLLFILVICIKLPNNRK